MKRSYEELETLLLQALEENQKLREEISKLKEKLGLNSKNSSKPPSTDQKSNSSNSKNGNRKGGRKGVARAVYPQEEIDHIIECRLTNCPNCGSNDLEATGKTQILQQAELPDVQAIITEYQRLKYKCPHCKKKIKGKLPPGVPNSAFGTKMMGLITHLTGVFHLAKRDSISFLQDMLGVKIATGSIPNIEERVTKVLDPIYDRIHSFIIEKDHCKHFDETSWRDSGKRHFAWIATHEKAAVYHIDPSRSSKAFERFIGEKANLHTVISDRYAVYNKVKNHQYCLAHLIRDFQKYAEREGLDQEIGTRLKKHLQSVCHYHGKHQKKEYSQANRNRQIGRLKSKIQIALIDGLANGSKDFSGLCERLLDNFEKLFCFMKTPGMEPTNNLAERDLRKLVLWRKKSYGTRSKRGQSFVERITTVNQTLRKHSQNSLTFIQKAIENFYAGIDPPMISESLNI